MKMTNEEVQEIVKKAEDNYEMLKDKVHDQYDEIQRLNNIINKAREYILDHTYRVNDDETYFVMNTEPNELIDILKGVDNNGNN